MSLVVDASVALAWFFNDERTELTERLLDQVADKGAVVPAVWPLEVSNGLLMGHRRDRLTKADFYASLETLNAIPVTVDMPSLTHVLAKVPHLAQAHQLTTYDAAYLELAIRLGAPLATLDGQLTRVAKKCNHPLVASPGELP